MKKIITNIKTFITAIKDADHFCLTDDVICSRRDGGAMEKLPAGMRKLSEGVQVSVCSDKLQSTKES